MKIEVLVMLFSDLDQAGEHQRMGLDWEIRQARSQGRQMTLRTMKRAYNLVISQYPAQTLELWTKVLKSQNKRSSSGGERVNKGNCRRSVPAAFAN